MSNIRTYRIGKHEIQVDVDKKYRMPSITASISYPVIGNVDSFMKALVETNHERTFTTAIQSKMKQFKPYFPNETGKQLFIGTHSTNLLIPLNPLSKRQTTSELGQIYDELMNTYDILRQSVA
ncbi:MAG: hypothetical protein V1870_04420 [Candidatus Aenigmatarchaeota archaeon]